MHDIAFYAPLKSPHHSVPSGEREMARNLIKAIESGWGNGIVRLASELRTHVPDGHSGAQAHLLERAKGEADHIIRQFAGNVCLWVTYHNYYKAPDLLGPVVSAELNIPYVIIEASRAKSRLNGEWARFAKASEFACDAARLIYYTTERDRFALTRDKTPNQDLIHLRPFLSIRHLSAETTRVPGRILTVGMFRDRDKPGSYQIIAETLRNLPGADWQLRIAGSGPARPAVEELMAPFGDRVHFLGQLDRTALESEYSQASVFFWPGFNEAYGMVYLEAQAAGLPVVAQDRDGVRDVVLPGHYPKPEEGAIPLAEMLCTLLDDPRYARTRSAQARAHVVQRHLLDTASDTFWKAARPLVRGGL